MARSFRAFRSLFAVFFLPLSEQLFGQSTVPASDSAKRLFIANAAAQWKKDYSTALARAKAAEARGDFSSIAPPQELIPFKDWDYYYTKGTPARWAPNAGQRYQAVVVPSGFVTDLTSVPQIFWSSGLRPEGSYAYAAIVHDYLYWSQERARPEADSIFLLAMEDSKVAPAVRRRIYDAVRLGGRRAWENNARAKSKGECRILHQLPTDRTISWAEWRKKPGVCRTK